MHISAGLEEEELKEIIEGPAGKVGLQFEEGLAEAVVRDVLAGGERAGRSTVLPLLEFALTELWHRRKEGYLTHEAYSAIGGVTGSLTQWADQAYQSLGQEGLGDVARRVLTELVNLGDERHAIPDSRRRRTLEDFGTDPAQREAARKVVMRLADARLVTTSFDQQNKHETCGDHPRLPHPGVGKASIVAAGGSELPRLEEGDGEEGSCLGGRKAR